LESQCKARPWIGVALECSIWIQERRSRKRLMKTTRGEGRTSRFLKIKAVYFAKLLEPSTLWHNIMCQKNRSLSYLLINLPFQRICI